MTVTLEEALSWRGRTMVDASDSKIGKIEQIYLDDASGEPEWALVNTGLFGTHSSFVPIRDARVQGDTVAVAYSKDHVKDAPRVGDDTQLSPDEERQLYRHYDVAFDRDAQRQSTSDTATEIGTAESNRGREQRAGTVPVPPPLTTPTSDERDRDDDSATRTRLRRADDGGTITITIAGNENIRIERNDGADEDQSPRRS